MNTARLFVWRPADDSCLVVETPLEVPSVDIPPSTRIPPVALRWCLERQLRVSFLATIGGIGCSDGSVHWGAWLRADTRTRDYATVPLTDIATQTRDPIVRRLAAELRTIRQCPDASSWIAFNPYWPETVMAWLARLHLGRHIGLLTPIRADRTSIVARGTVDNRSVFFTARAQPLNDPHLCDVLNVHAPNSAPRTIAFDADRRWWLTADVGGGSSMAYLEQARSLSTGLSHLMSAMAETQIATIGSIAVQSLSFEVSLPAIHDGIERAASSRASAVAGADTLWAAAQASEVPLAWIHSDPSPDNIRVSDDGRLVFIDMEDPWYGPAPLMGALALHSLSRRQGWTREQSQLICGTAWTHYVRAYGLSSERHRFEPWLRLAELVRLIRRVEASARGPGRLLHEETPRRARAIASELQRLCGVA